jgi:hypothetical protein
MYPSCRIEVTHPSSEIGPRISSSTLQHMRIPASVHIRKIWHKTAPSAREASRLHLGPIIRLRTLTLHHTLTHHHTQVQCTRLDTLRLGPRAYVTPGETVEYVLIYGPEPRRSTPKAVATTRAKPEHMSIYDPEMEPTNSKPGAKAYPELVEWSRGREPRANKPTRPERAPPSSKTRDCPTPKPVVYSTEETKAGGNCESGSIW